MELLKFKPGRVYLTGLLPLIGSGEYQPHLGFGPWRKKLEAKGYEVLTYTGFFSTIDYDSFSDSDLMRSRIAILISCEKVYTLPYWDVCEKVVQEVAVARILKIEVNTVLNIDSE